MSDLQMITGADVVGCGFDAVFSDATDLNGLSSVPYRARVLNLPVSQNDVGDPAKGQKWPHPTVPDVIYWLPEGLNAVRGIQGGGDEAKTFSSLDELASHLAAEAGLSVSYGLFEASAEFKLATSVKTSASVTSAIIEKSNNFWALSLANPMLQAAVFDRNFVAAVKSLPDSMGDYSEAVIKPFLEGYGSHLVIGVSVGSSLRFFATEASTTTQTQAELKAAVEAVCEVTASAHGEVEQKTEAFSRWKQSHTLIRAFGGDPTLCDSLGNGKLTYFSEWIGSTALHPGIRQVRLVPIANAIAAIDAKRGKAFADAIEIFLMRRDAVPVYALDSRDLTPAVALTRGVYPENIWATRRLLCLAASPDTSNAALRGLRPVLAFEQPLVATYLAAHRGQAFEPADRLLGAMFFSFQKAHPGMRMLYRYTPVEPKGYAFRYGFDAKPPEGWGSPVELGYVFPADET